MQLKSFNKFIKDVIVEGRRLQRHDITGKQTTTRRFTDTQIIGFIISVISVLLLPQGLSKDFAGYAISFLGIFIGLFSSIVISMYDKRANLFEHYDDKIQTDKAKTLIVKNYLVQFTGLTSYAIFLAIILIVLLSLILLFQKLSLNIFKFHFVESKSQINFTTIKNFFCVLVVILQRYLTLYFLFNFFIITLFSITSYFSFLSSQYKSIKLKND